MVEGVGSRNQLVQHSAVPVAVACHGCSPLQGVRSRHVMMAHGCSQPQEGARKANVVMLPPGYIQVQSTPAIRRLFQAFTMMPELVGKEAT